MAGNHDCMLEPEKCGNRAQATVMFAEDCESLATSRKEAVSSREHFLRLLNFLACC